MTDWLQIRREPLARLLFGLFLVIQGSAIVFRHSHQLSNGAIIVHCHPYKPFCQGPFQPNDHTSNELFWLAAVANLLYDEAPTFGFAFALPLLVIEPTFGQLRPQFIQLPFFCFLQRGPPALPSLLV